LAKSGESAFSGLYPEVVNRARQDPQTVNDLMNVLVSEPGRPRITWYGPQGERVELSGAVLQNWVSKTVNLLVEEFDAGPGTRVILDLPVHWRTVLWALGAWRCGATVTLEGPDAPAESAADVVVTTRPDAWGDAGAELVAVALPALARRFDGDLTPGAIDAAAAVMTYGDVVTWAPEPDPEEVALEAPGLDAVRFAELVPGGPAAAPGARALVDGGRPVGVVLRELVDIWAADGSAVLVEPATMAGLRADEARLVRLRETERVTG
jgi:uncharacterized protein (TIGR03089 family)